MSGNVSFMLRRLVLIPLLAFSLILGACDATELQEWQRLSGADLTAEDEQAVLDLHADIDYVNSLPYASGVAAPAEEAFRVVAARRGWSQNAIDAWLPAAIGDFAHGESGFCWNVIGGSTFANPGVDCTLARVGTRSDAGFGQLIGVHYRGWLCNQEGLCSKWDIVASPWASMTAFLALLERSGKAGWCYDARSIKYHSWGCKNAPKQLPLSIT